MGCCTSRPGDVVKINREKLSTFIESQKFDTLSCKRIRKIEKKVLNHSEFVSLTESLSIPLPFELVEINSKVFPLELKLTLLLFSKDSYEEKSKLFNRILKTPRQRLRFFEWKYQLTNERLPRLMRKVKELGSDEEKFWFERYRFSAGDDIIMNWEMKYSQSISSNMNSLYTVNVYSAEIFKKKVLGFKTFVTISHSGHIFNTSVAKGNEPFWNHSITLCEKTGFALVSLYEKGIFSDDVIGEGIVMLKQSSNQVLPETKIPLFSYDKKIAEVTLKVEDLIKGSFRNSKKINKMPSSHPLPELKSAVSDPQYSKSIPEEFKLASSEKSSRPKTPPLSLITYGVQLNDIQFDQMIYTSQSGKQEVFIGRISSLNKRIVIKVSHCDDNQEFNMVQREAMAISQLSHPNICQVYGTLLDMSGKKLKNLIILEFCEGKPLRKIIEARQAAGFSFSEAEVLSLLKQLIGAFSHIQSKKIIHSDIKPDNIVFSDDGVAKIIDFGMSLSNYSDIFETAKTLKVGGTILYFSPLQIKAYVQYIQGQNPNCTVKHNPLKSDVFSLGLSFIHITTMNPPLGLNNFDSELSSRLSNVISQLNYSDYIKGIISDMLIIDENLRPDFFELKIQVVVLRHSTAFKTITEERSGFSRFKENCKKFCPIPVKDFLIIHLGKVLNEADKEEWEEVKKTRKVFMMIQSFIEYNEPIEFKREKKKKNLGLAVFLEGSKNSLYYIEHEENQEWNSTNGLGNRPSAHFMEFIKTLVTSPQRFNFTYD